MRISSCFICEVSKCNLNPSCTNPSKNSNLKLGVSSLLLLEFRFKEQKIAQTQHVTKAEVLGLFQGLDQGEIGPKST